MNSAPSVGGRLLEDFQVFGFGRAAMLVDYRLTMGTHID